MSRGQPLFPLPPKWQIATSHGECYAGGWHPGWDLDRTDQSSAFEPIYAAEDGRVTFADFLPGWGYLIVIEHGTLWTRYGHCWQMYVLPGQRVKAGDWIGAIGFGDGNRFSPHLHWDLPKVEIDPGYWPRTEAECLSLFEDPLLV